MSALIDDPKTEDLFNTILALKNLKEAKAFFRDLLTEAELDEFGNRWLAAKMLNSGVSYNHIRQATGLSTTTIARISKWLKRGKGGYKLMLKRSHFWFIIIIIIMITTTTLFSSGRAWVD